MATKAGAGAGQAHDAVVSTGEPAVGMSEHAFAEDQVERMRRKVEKAQADVDAAQAALTTAEAALAAQRG